MNKVKPVVDMEMAEFAPQGHVSRITIKLKDQKEFTEAIINPKGNPENPFTTDELEKRFRKHTTTFLSEDKKDLILTNVSKLENIKNINELTYKTSKGEGRIEGPHLSKCVRNINGEGEHLSQMPSAASE